jgi:hypothetical protein
MALTGFFPSHLSFLLLHLSHACETRLRGPFFPVLGVSSDGFWPPSLPSADVGSSNLVWGDITCLRNSGTEKLRARVGGRPKGKAAWINHGQWTRRAYGVCLNCQVMLLVSYAAVSMLLDWHCCVGGLTAPVRPSLTTMSVC